MPRLALTAYTRYGIIFFDELELCPKGDNLALFVKAKRCEQGWTQVQLADYAGTGKKARIDGGNFRVFAKTIGLNERQTDHAFSRIADSVEANLGDVLAVS